LDFVLQLHEDKLWALKKLMHCKLKSDQKDVEYAANGDQDNVRDVVSSEAVAVDKTDSTGSSSGK